MAAATPPSADPPWRVGVLAIGLLVVVASAVLYHLLARPPVGVGAPAPHATPRGGPVDARTLLDIGDQVEALSDGMWCDAIVVSTEDDGLVRVHYVGWPESYDENLTRERLRFVDEPPGEDAQGLDAGPQ